MYETPTTKQNVRERALGQIKTEDPLWGHYVAQPLAARLSILLWRTPLTPHHITILSLVIGILAAFFFSFGNYTAMLVGALLLNISLILDCSDGHIARLKNLSSFMGGWMDYHADKMKDIFVLLGFTYGAAQHSPNFQTLLFVAAFVAIAFQFLRNISALHRDMHTLQMNGKKDKKRSVLSEKKESSQWMRSLQHTLLFKLADRVFFFTFFALLFQPALAVCIYALLECGYAFVSSAINYKMYYKEDLKKSL